MWTPDERTKVQRLWQACRVLEAQAGISTAMQRAREGPFIPLGALRESPTPDEYFANEYDYFRRKARDAYFSVKDAAQRRKLIAAQRAIDACHNASNENEVARSLTAVAAAKAKSRNLPWGGAAAVSIGAVAIGYVGFALVGAIAGSVAGWFLGQGMISDAKTKATADVDRETEDLEHARQERELNLLQPECFSAIEEATGERDDALDRESAYANVIRARIK